MVLPFLHSGPHLSAGRELELPSYHAWSERVMDPPRRYAFRAHNAFLLENSDDKPHVGAAVLDTTEAKEGEVLRSEVAVAVALLKYQFRRGDFLRHHTLPVCPLSSTRPISRFRVSTDIS